MIEIFKQLERYNLWSSLKHLPIGYERKGYLKKFQPALGNKLIKVIVGQRRAGKSYLIRQIIHELIRKGIPPKNTLYLNKELMEFETINDAKKLHDLITFTKKKLKTKGKMFVILDEVQNIDGWEKVVSSLAQNPKENYELIITGSNSTLLSGELASRLSGRYITFEVLPFSFQEYCDFLNLERGKKSYLSYLSSGGLPELFHLTTEEIRRHYVSSLRDTILLKDIVERYNIKDASLLERVFQFLADNIGNLSSLNSIVNALKSSQQRTNHDTVSHYVRSLEQTYLVHEVQRFDIKGKNIFSGSKKYYLNDLAFRNFLSSRFDEGLGKHLENSIYLHYRERGYKIFVGSIQGAEVDFIIENEQERKYVQVAYSLAEKRVSEREFRPLENIHDAHEKIVISLDDVSFGNKEGIKHICAWDL
ncbi:MAG: ATP-binding protein [bacterium]|nr:ATP-binding protein [bacterium]